MSTLTLTGTTAPRRQTASAAADLAQSRPALAGAREMSGMLGGLLPFAFVIGASAAHGPVPLAALASAGLVYGGSAQLLLVQLTGTGAGLAAVLLGVLAIQVRLAMYTAVLAPHWRHCSRRGRLLAAQLMIDPMFLLATEGYARPWPARARHQFYLGAGITLWISWVLALAAGTACGNHLPAGLHAEAIAPLYLIALLTRTLRSSSEAGAGSPRPARLTAVATGAGAAAVVHLLPFGLGPAPAIAIGVLSGLAVWSSLDRRPSPADLPADQASHKPFRVPSPAPMFEDANLLRRIR